MKPEHMRTERIKTGAMSLLDTHDNWSMDHRMGVVLADSLRFEKGKVYAKVQISKNNARSQVLLKDLADGMPFAVSVGYRIYGYIEQDGDGDGSLPVRTAVDWEPFEVSAVPVPADAGALSRSQTQEETHMPDDTTTHRRTVVQTPPTTEPTSPDLARRAIQDDMARRHEDRANVDADIVSLARKFGFEPNAPLVRSALRKGQSYDTFRERLMDELTKDDAEITTNHIGSQPVTTASRVAEQIEDAMTVHLGGTSKIADNPMLSRSPLELGRAFFASRGLQANELSDLSVARAMLTGRASWLSGRAMSTGDFPMILENSIRKSLLERFHAQPSVLKSLSRERTATDFRKHSMVRRGENPELKKVGENGEIRHSSFGEERDVFQLETFAVMTSLTFQTLVNDDLGAFSDMLEGFADSAAELEATRFHEILDGHATGSLTMDDGTPAFHASRANVGTAAALSLDALSGARQAMRNQRGVDKTRYSGVTPAVLLVGPSQETLADQLVTQIAAAKVDDVNSFGGRLQVLVEDRIEGDEWFLFGNPKSRPAFVHGYLEGHSGPDVETRDGWQVLGSEFRCVLHFGAALVDWRACYFNPGQ